VVTSEASSAPSIPGCPDLGEQRVDVEDLGGQPGPHRTTVAQVAGEPAGVDALDPDHPGLGERGPQVALGRQDEGRRAASRTTKPATWIRSDSMSASLRP
jgi:hypothetical protein